MERSYIKDIDLDFINELGLSPGNVDMISDLINRAVRERLYTDTKDFQHDLKHVERVLTYVMSIVNRMKSKGVAIAFERELLLAALYHDIGKTIGASGKDHGIVGSRLVKEKLDGLLDDDSIRIIQLLIDIHASEEDTIDFSNEKFDIEEQEAIQLIANILKDSDALDRTRLNYPPPIGKCDIKKLRTEEAKEVLPLTDYYLREYNEAVIKGKGNKVSRSYEVLDSWIKQYKEKDDGSGYMFHASMDPTIEKLTPRESTQKGSYVYAGIDPVDCIKMAIFRTSTLFPRSKGTIYELFPGLIEETLRGKTITIYRLPEGKFHEYKALVTASPHREWVSTEAVEPVEEVTLDAMECVKYLNEKGYIKTATNTDRKMIIDTFIRTFEMYVWDLKHKKGQEFLDKKAEMIFSIIGYYDSSYIPVLQEIKKIYDGIIKMYETKYYETHQELPDYDNEKHLKNILELAHKEFTPEMKEYLENLVEEKKELTM